jgi:hypothetical protein
MDPIKTRADLEAAVTELLGDLDARAKASPDAAAFWRQFQVQLEALRAWMAKGNTPTDEQLDMIDVGWLAVRELDGEADPSVAELQKKLVRLQDFVMKWDV